jgi:hypothetical protein
MTTRINPRQISRDHRWVRAKSVMPRLKLVNVARVDRGYLDSVGDFFLLGSSDAAAPLPCDNERSLSLDRPCAGFHSADRTAGFCLGAQVSTDYLGLRRGCHQNVGE